MYKKFFGLRCSPFEDRIQPEFLFTYPDLDEVLASMECEIRYRQGLGLIVGEAGTGKTLLVRLLLTKLDPQEPAVVIRCPADGNMDVVRETCKGFGVTLPEHYDAKRGLARLRRRLLDIHQQKRLAVLIVDQAENVSAEAMVAMESLFDLSREDKQLLTILLVGQPRLTDVLGQPLFDRLRQQLSSEIRLHKFTSARTQEYITHRLRVAGAGEKTIFDASAMAVIHIVTKGIPRLINRLADASMIAAYSDGKSCVTAGMVREMTHEENVKSQPTLSKLSVAQEEIQMSKLVSRVDSTIQAMKGDDMNISGDDLSGSEPAGLSGRAQSLIARLEQTISQTQHTTAKLEQRAKEITDQVQDQLRELESETSRVGSSASDVQPQLHRIEKTCDRAVKIEAELSAFAETLVERADSVQQRISLLMTAMTDADACRENIHTITHQAVETCKEAQRSVQGAQTTIEQAQQEFKENQRVANETVDHLRKKIRHIDEDAQRSYQHLVEKERNKLAHCLSDVIKESIEDFKEKLSQVTQETLDAQQKTSQKLKDEFHVDVDRVSSEACTRVSSDVEALSVRKDDMLASIKHEMDTQQASFSSMTRDVLETATSDVEALTAKKEDILASIKHEMETQQASFSAMTRDVLVAATSDVEELMAMKEHTLASTKHEMDKQQASLASMTKVAQARIEKIQADRVAILRHTMEGLAEELSETIENKVEEAKRHVTQLQDRATTTVQSTSKQLDHLVQKHTQAWEAQEKSHSSQEKQLESLATKRVALSSQIDDLAAHVDATDMMVKNSKLAVVDLQQVSQTVQMEIKSTIDQGRAMTGDVTNACGRVESLQRSIANTLLEVGGACERLNMLSEKADKSAKFASQIDDLAAQIKSTEAFVHDSKTVVADMQQAAQTIQKELTTTIDRGRAMTGDVTNACERVESLQHSISNTLLEAGGACERLHTLNEKADRAEKLAGKLENVLGTHNGQCAQLERLVSQANKAVELLQPAVASADEKAGRLQSHHAAASSLLNKMTKASVDGQSMLQQFEVASVNAKQLVERTSSKVDRMIQDIWGLTTKAEATSKTLSAIGTDATARDQHDVEASPQAVATDSEQPEDIDNHTDQKTEEVVPRGNTYEKLAAQVNSIAKVLNKAQDVAKSTREELAEAKETYAKLTTISQVANEQIANLDTLVKSAYGMIETHEQLQLETATSTKEFQQHLAAMADTTDAGMQMINEFTKQTIDIEKQLRAATRKSAQLQANVAEALAQPGEIVADAKEQAAQLEQVCTAVRKVFSALSQTSLEAQEKIKQFHESKVQAQADMTKLKNTTIQVSERIQSTTKSGMEKLQNTARQTAEHVRSESSRACQTLSEWVQETKRAQQRLEHAMQYVPPISQTHPVQGTVPATDQVATLDLPDTKMAPLEDNGILDEKQVPV